MLYIFFKHKCIGKNVCKYVFISYANSDSSVTTESGLYVESLGSTFNSDSSSSSNTRRGLLLGLKTEPLTGVEDSCTSGNMSVVWVPTS